MNKPCPFDQSRLSFVGSPVQQAGCLLRFVEQLGKVDDTPATLPAVLAGLLGAPETMDVTKAQLRSYLQRHAIAESTVGGSLDDPVCRADTDNPSKPLARYFVIHDTSTKLSSGQTFDPNFINTASWSGNKLSSQPRGKTHIYITRLGETLTDADYHTPRQRRSLNCIHRTRAFGGYFCTMSSCSQRMGRGASNADSPDPGFTKHQMWATSHSSISWPACGAEAG